MMPAMQVLADANQVNQMLDTLAEQIASTRDAEAPLAIVGIRRRGDLLADRLADRLEPDHVGTVDITLYRDDLSEVGAQPVVRTTEIDFDVDGCEVVLVDDVLMTGRSVRAAIQSLLDFGRPKRIRLAVLIDRGGRELPIAADLAGMAVDVGDEQHVRVYLEPTDKEDRIVQMSHDEAVAAR
jgi:pyrimidine operon attenuation protein/uracil phosphoribosyltransferase